MSEFFSKLKNGILGQGDAFVFAVIALILGMIVIKLIMIATRKMLERTHLARVTIKFIATMVKFVLWLFLIYIIWNILGIPSTLFVALTSVSGVAISLALQGVLSNIASGVIQLGGKRFKEGDFVEIDGVSGTVLSVDFISIKLSTVDEKIIYVPNSKSTTENFVNFSENKTRRVDIDVSVAYKTDIDEVKNLIGNIIDSDIRVLKNSEKTVRLFEMGESSLNFVVRCYVKTADYWGVYFDLNEKIYLALTQAGIEIPFKKIDVNLKNV